MTLTCGVEMIDPAFGLRHTCAEPIRHTDPTHVCPCGQAAWQEIGTKPVDPDVEWDEAFLR